MPVTVVGRTLLLLQLTVKEMGRFAVHRMAGALAFFALFGIPPLLLIVMTVAGLVLGDEPARDGLLHQVETTLGPASRATAEGIFRNMPKPGEGDISTQIFSIVVLFFGATLTFYQLQAILNEVWGAPNRRGWWRFLAVVIKRSLTFVMLAATGLLVILWLGASALLRKFPEDLAEFLSPELLAFVSGGLEAIVAFVLLATHFAITFKVLPDARVPIRAAIYGALVAAALFLGGRHIVELYLQHRDLGTAFGAAGSLVITLVWVYAAALITLIGAVYSRTYTKWKALVTAVKRPATKR